MVNWFTILITYLVVWWMVLFIALPFGARPPADHELGHSTGAPARTHLGLKVLVTSFVSAIVTWMFFAFTSGLLIATP
ncbi:MAG: DUF1467 family protein [Alphaproteobacteria bacterium]|nr:DUF1467 family protein [Alphaproteobacteria bacterium]